MYVSVENRLARDTWYICLNKEIYRKFQVWLFYLIDEHADIICRPKLSTKDTISQTSYIAT